MMTLQSWRLTRKWESIFRIRQLSYLSSHTSALLRPRRSRRGLVNGDVRRHSPGDENLLHPAGATAGLDFEEAVLFFTGEDHLIALAERAEDLAGLGR